jgi:predicted HTH transcriptional regulator
MLGKKLGKKLGKNRIRIIELIVSNPNITYSELSGALSVSSTTIENRIAEMSGVIIKRVGPKNGGHWEIIKN